MNAEPKEPAPLDLLNAIALGHTALAVSMRPPLFGPPGMVIAIIEGIGLWDLIWDYIQGLQGPGQSCIAPTFNLNEGVGKFLDHIAFLEAQVMTVTMGDLMVASVNGEEVNEPMNIWIIGFVGKQVCNDMAFMINSSPSNAGNSLPLYE